MCWSEFCKVYLICFYSFEEVIAASDKFAPHEHQWDSFPVVFCWLLCSDFGAFGCLGVDVPIGDLFIIEVTLNLGTIRTIISPNNNILLIHLLSDINK